jgi:hypothetical protein
MRRLMIVGILALAACGGGGSALEGIYTVDAWNDNPASCADPGPSTIADHDPLVWVKKKSFFGQSVLSVDDCTDNAACGTDADSDSLGSFFFDQGSDGDGWVSEFIISSGPDGNNMCGGAVIRNSLTADDSGMAFGIRVETIESAPYAATGGECSTDDAKAAAEGQPCVSLETMHATFTADL